MYRRYRNLTEEYIYNALNKLRASFLAARDGNDVEEIIKGILTYDERLKIGRRIEIAEMLRASFIYQEIATELKVGLNTISSVDKMMRQYPRCYELIKEREDKVEREYEGKTYESRGGSKMVFKRKAYTGFKRQDVSR